MPTVRKANGYILNQRSLEGPQKEACPQLFSIMLQSTLRIA
jgi:hypothetical protein